MGKNEGSEVRRRLLAQALPELSPTERASMLAKHLGRAGARGVQSDLSNGFAGRHLRSLRDFFESREIEFNDADWKTQGGPSGRVIAVHDPRHGLNLLFDGGFREFICIRAPSPHPPRLPTGELINVNPSGRVDLSDYAKHNPPGAHLKEAWSKVKKGTLSGIAITAMGRIGAIAETWAAAELVRKHKAQAKVRIFVLPGSKFLSEQGQFLPFMGARVVDRTRCQLSTPLSSSRERSYSSILHDKSLCATINDYAARLINFSDEVSEMHIKNQIDDVFQQEFNALSRINPRFSTQYGNLDSFSRVRDVKDEIIRLADLGEWFPPLI